jgi:hypothetical protein
MQNKLILEQIAMLCEYIAKLPTDHTQIAESVKLIKVLSSQLN